MTREEVEAFLKRDWDLARRTKDEAVGTWVRVNGTAAAFRLAQALLDQVWPLVRRGLKKSHDVFDVSPCLDHLLA